MKHEFEPIAAINITHPGTESIHLLELGVAGDVHGLSVDHKRIVKVTGVFLPQWLQQAIESPDLTAEVDLKQHDISHVSALSSKRQLHRSNYSLKRALGCYPFMMEVNMACARIEVHPDGSLQENFAPGL